VRFHGKDCEHDCQGVAGGSEAFAGDRCGRARRGQRERGHRRALQFHPVLGQRFSRDPPPRAVGQWPSRGIVFRSPKLDLVGNACTASGLPTISSVSARGGLDRVPSMIYDDVIMRTIVDLTEEQLAALLEFCEREKISRAEAVRRAVDVLLSQQKPLTREQTFGTWPQRGDSRTVVEELRKEWSR
jgi:hypothetical protein